MALSPIPESQAASAIVAIRSDGGRMNLAWSYGASKAGDAVATAMSTCRSTLRYNKAKGSCEMVAHYDGPGFIAIVLARAEDDQRLATPSLTTARKPSGRPTAAVLSLADWTARKMPGTCSGMAARPGWPNPGPWAGLSTPALPRWPIATTPTADRPQGRPGSTPRTSTRL
jgi:hypothetical protein